MTFKLKVSLYPKLQITGFLLMASVSHPFFSWGHIWSQDLVVDISFPAVLVLCDIWQICLPPLLPVLHHLSFLQVSWCAGSGWWLVFAPTLTTSRECGWCFWGPHAEVQSHIYAHSGAAITPANRFVSCLADQPVHLQTIPNNLTEFGPINSFLSIKYTGQWGNSGWKGPQKFSGSTTCPGLSHLCRIIESFRL